MEQLEMWPAAYKTVQTLKAAGYQAVFAGGCVRDLYLCRMPKDIDIATSAKPWEVELLFPKSIAIGKAFGVITVQQGSFSFEIATFRKDGHYEDGRHPESVEFCEMEEDAKRRDFTINGLFYDPNQEDPMYFQLERVIDYVGGIEDLRKGVIRFIGDPKERIREDKLRMLRAIRFAARYNFRIELASMKAIWNNASSILQVSAERIREEILQILCSPKPYDALQAFMDSGLLPYVLPEVSQLVGVKQGTKYHWKEAKIQKIIRYTRVLSVISVKRRILELGPYESFDPNNPEHLDPEKYIFHPGDAWEHTKIVTSYVPSTPVMRIAALLHDIAKPQTFKIRHERPTFYGHEDRGEIIAREILTRLKCSNDFIAEVTWLVRNHMKFFQIKNMKRATLIKLFRQPYFLSLLDLHYADIMGSNGDLNQWNYAKEKYEELKSSFNPVALLNGDDLTALGFTPGPLYRDILRHVETLQLEGALKTPEAAKEFVLQHYPKEANNA